MKRTAIVAALALLVATAALATAPSVAGNWTMTIEGSPHGNMTAGLVLKQDGTKVTGTFASGHTADMTVSGEFVNGELKIETAGDGDSKISFTGKLKEDGTLAGYISSPMGDMRWTAARADTKDRK